MSSNSMDGTQEQPLIFRCRPQYKIIYAVDVKFEQTAQATLMEPAGNVLPENYKSGACSVDSFAEFMRNLVK